ncbi:hypothetical protein FB451DRAFT_1181074 [Mycena latifolia]|nr:hypothetical protein FB451DRAFT_1181074 [Mycena latifolia]
MSKDRDEGSVRFRKRISESSWGNVRGSGEHVQVMRLTLELGQLEQGDGKTLGTAQQAEVVKSGCVTEDMAVKNEISAGNIAKRRALEFGERYCIELQLFDVPLAESELKMLKLDRMSMDDVAETTQLERPVARKSASSSSSVEKGERTLPGPAQRAVDESFNQVWLRDNVIGKPSDSARVRVALASAREFARRAPRGVCGGWLSTSGCVRLDQACTKNAPLGARLGKFKRKDKPLELAVEEARKKFPKISRNSEQTLCETLIKKRKAGHPAWITHHHNPDRATAFARVKRNSIGEDNVRTLEAVLATNSRHIPTSHKQHDARAATVRARRVVFQGRRSSGKTRDDEGRQGASRERQERFQGGLDAGEAASLVQLILK